MDQKEVLEKLRNLNNDEKIKVALSAALNGSSITRDVIPVIADTGCISYEAAELFVNNIVSLSLENITSSFK